MDQTVQSACSIKYGMALRRRLVLSRVNPSVQRTIFQLLLDMMEKQKLDLVKLIRPRMLRSDNNSGAITLGTFIAELLRGTPEPECLDSGKATKEWLAWLDTYAAHIECEKTGGKWAGDEARRWLHILALC
ncbi:hypothetical protein F5J12DRAFT_831578 [Pisolithus orientalis]|uniref:uncharacterized protein n=1 Tax=Pisolithus orientalis TaxID=936130 RepID=UPI002224E2DB|nr:uncharacterized protein F5J12DRAFT_831578 [Pisolithus orientalis]KAI6006580.1 hypothetical protein F5J12DRAFT_831578 [Pisolithus orientalis]